MRIFTLLITWLLSSPITSFGQLRQSVPYSFNLSTKATTSAGVFTKDGTLIRTLWSGVSLESGSYNRTWDGIDDQGRLAPDAAYDIRVLSNNVSYQWEGVIANSSFGISQGNATQRAFLRMRSIAITNNTAYFCTGYSEGNPAQAKFLLDNPQQKIEFFPKGQTGQASTHVVTDGTTVYWAGSDPFNATNSFVFGSKVSDDTQTTFANGASLKTVYGPVYTSTIDILNQGSSTISGLAVQRRGPFLFVARKDLNQLHVLNKTTGQLIQTLTITAPRHLTVGADDNLWMVSGTNTVANYVVQSNGTLNTSRLSLGGLSDPLALAITPDPNGSIILVADGADSQQIKGFSVTNGALTGTIGRPGGYAQDPVVSDDKFYFSDLSGGIHDTFISFQPDGSFWVGDSGNYRVQHYSSSIQLVNRIMYMQHFYSCYVDPNQPSRVVGEYLEFNVDYDKPLGADNGSWQLVRNWRAAVPSAYYQDFTANVLQSVTTLRNGRTYALLLNNLIRQWGVFELPPSGQLRFTGILLDKGIYPYQIAADGSLRHLVTGAISIGNSLTWQSQSLTGFDNMNNPQWGPAQTMASLPSVSAEDPVDWYGEALPGQVTTSGILVSFDKNKVGYGHGQGFHLGGVRLGANQWQWRTAHATATDYTGPYPTDGAYDIGNSIEYGGGDVTVAGRHIFWNYHGEFWKQSQTNKWQHVYENGLLVGQFGVTGPEVIGQEAAPGMAGNVFFGNAVLDNKGNAYLWHNEESGHAGVHRWKISGLNTIQEQVIPINLSASTHGLLASYYEGEDLNNLNLTTSRVVEMVSIPDQAESVRWSGFVMPTFSESYTFQADVSQKVRLWVDGTLVIDQWANSTPGVFSSKAISLQAGKRYELRMEISDGRASLAWSSGSQPKQLIPASQLYTATAPDISEGVDLLEGLPRSGVLEENIYGWHRNPTQEDNNGYFDAWNAKTSIKTYDRFSSPDLFVRFAQQSATYTVTRDLGNKPTVSSWRLSGTINQDGTTFNNTQKNGKSGGYYIEVLDDQTKVIVRLSFQVYFGQAGGNPAEIVGNNTRIAYGDYFTSLGPESTHSQPVIISMANGNVTFKYGPYQPISTNIFDPSSNWSKPKTFRMYFWGKGINYPRTVDIEQMHFATNVAQTTSSAIIVTADDNSNILRASSTLETAEIVVSVDGGSYIPYTGEILVGNVATREGYWKFRLKTNSNELVNTEVISPAFTINEDKLKLSVYPNPGQDILSVSHPVAYGECTLTIQSTDGKELTRIVPRASASMTIIDVTLLPKGTYMLQFNDELRKTSVRFIKQ